MGQKKRTIEWGWNDFNICAQFKLKFNGPESLKIKNFILPTILNIEVVSGGKAIETVPSIHVL